MIDDRNPYFGRGFRVSSAELGQLKRKWADVGRQVWDAGIARQVRAVGAAQAKADSLRQAQDKSLRRTATSVAKTAVHLGRAGTASDPGPGRLAAEWATGLGPEKRVLAPESAMSREFVQAPSVQEYLRRHVADWRQRDGGVSGIYVHPHARRANFGEREFLMDLEAGNGASHVVGSWDATGERRGDRIGWTVENDANLNSFGAGRILRKSGLPSLPVYSRPWPGGRTHQTIQFSTDLNGMPLRPDG